MRRALVSLAAVAALCGLTGCGHHTWNCPGTIASCQAAR